MRKSVSVGKTKRAGRKRDGEMEDEKEDEKEDEEEDDASAAEERVKEG